MQNPLLWFEDSTVNGSSLPAPGINSVVDFSSSRGGVTFDKSNPLPLIEIVPRGKRGIFSSVGFNYNPNRPTNIENAEIQLTFKEGTTQIYPINMQNNKLFMNLPPNYDVSKVSFQILRTTDNQPARNVELLVFVCGKGKTKTDHHLKNV